VPAAALGASPLAGLRYLAVSVTLFGGIWPITKHALEHGASPLWFALNRAGLATLTSALLLLALRRFRVPARSDLPAVVAIGLLQLGGFFALTHLALDYVPAGRTAILCNVTVFWLIPLSVWVLGDRVSPRQWWAAAVGLAGVLALMAPWSLLAGGASLAMLPGYALLLAALGVAAIAPWKRRPAADDPLERRFAVLLLPPLAAGAFVVMLAQFPLELAAPRLMFLTFGGLALTWIRSDERR
jgi:drug/metabolite transporter (DMT)-like permease